MLMFRPQGSVFHVHIEIINSRFTVVVLLTGRFPFAKYKDGSNKNRPWYLNTHPCTCGYSM